MLQRQNATRNDDFAIEELVLQSIADRGKSKQLFGEGNKQKLKTKKGTKLKVSQKLKVKPEKLFVIEHYLHDMFKPEVSPFASHKSLKDEKKFNLETLFDSSAETIPKKTYSKATPNKARKKSVGFGRLFRSDPLPAHISKFVNRSPERVDPIRHISTVFRDEMVIEPANLVQTEDIREIGIVDETDIGVPMFYSPKRVCGNATKNDVGKGKNKDQQDGKSVKKKISESTITSFTDVLKAETLNSLKPNKCEYIFNVLVYIKCFTYEKCSEPRMNLSIMDKHFNDCKYVVVDFINLMLLSKQLFNKLNSTLPKFEQLVKLRE